jgi:nicotinamide riboside kinase
MIRISITGPESTGKSALSRQLADYFEGVYVPEFAREYLELNGPKYTKDTVEFIAARQIELQNQEFEVGIPIVIFDTDLFVCKIWMEHVFGDCPQWINEAISLQNFELSLLMQVDLPWEDDPLREHPRERTMLFEKYHNALVQSSQSFEIIKGLGDERFKNALEKIKQHFPELFEH